VFTLNPRIDADTAFILDTPLSHLLLMDEVTYPWVMLVPRRAGVIEIGDLSPADRVTLIEEVARASAMMRALHAPDRINVAALGNVVPQLHVHVVARFTGDPAWPAPIWGKAAPVRFAPAARDARVAELRRAWEAACS